MRSFPPPLRHALPAAALAFLAACGSLTDPLSPDAAGVALARKPAPPPPAVTHVPILFVHGYNASSSTWTTMVSRFKTDGYTDRELANFSYNYRQSNVTTATMISVKVDSIRAATGAPTVTIITHSMGALSARYYLRNGASFGKVDAMITLGGANHGTNTAAFCFDTSCREMVPGSSFLTALNADDETPGAFRYAAWWSPCDEVINPQSSARLAGAQETQTACLKHSALHEDATVYAQVKAWVNQPAAALLM